MAAMQCIAIDGFHVGRLGRYAIGAGADTAFVDLIERPDVPRGQVAAGPVHHVAWRVADDTAILEWQQELTRQEAGVTDIRDRQYFRSIYFREPGGVLFEIATDLPGFATDETPADLGTHLMLPPWLEPRRVENRTSFAADQCCVMLDA